MSRRPFLLVAGTICAAFVSLGSLALSGSNLFGDEKPVEAKMPAAVADDGPESKKETPGQEFSRLREKFEGRLDRLKQQTDELQAQLEAALAEQFELSEQLVAKTLELAETHADEAASLEGIHHLLKDHLESINEEQATKLFEVLKKHHAARPEIAAVCEILSELELTEEITLLLEEVADKNTSPLARAWANFALASAAYHLAETSGDEDGHKVAEQLFAKIVAEVPDDESEGSPLDSAKQFLFELQNLTIGKTSPDFESMDLSGKRVKFSSLRGKVVLLNFWSTWCDGCREQAPHLRALAKQYSGDELAIVNVSGDDDAATVRDFVLKSPVPGKHWWNGPEGGVIETWNVQAYPTTFLIDANGVIRQRNPDSERLEAEIERLVKEKNSAPKPQDK